MSGAKRKNGKIYVSRVQIGKVVIAKPRPKSNKFQYFWIVTFLGSPILAGSSQENQLKNLGIRNDSSDPSQYTLEELTTLLEYIKQQQAQLKVLVGGIGEIDDTLEDLSNNQLLNKVIRQQAIATKNQGNAGKISGIENLSFFKNLTNLNFCSKS